MLVGVACAEPLDLLNKASPPENKHSIQSVTLGFWLTPGSKERLALDPTPCSLSHSLHPSFQVHRDNRSEDTEHQMLTLKE